MQVEKDKVVAMEYTLTNGEGEVLDTSDGREPLAYIHGSGSIIPGLESALEGKSSGEQIQVAVSPEEGYGARDDSLMQTVPKDRFQGVEDLDVGMQFRAQSDQGEHVVTVVEVEGDEVTIDGNHPLAGETLHFDVTIVEVRDATGEELEHGHVHGPGGHHH
ncbi:MAG: peptidylprolyl isomerase [bacterium]|nr:peptidylprolyl isomerase [bacterium]